MSQTRQDSTRSPRVERIDTALGRRIEGPVLFLHGPEIWDSYVSDNLVEFNIDEALLRTLQARGFDRVLFHSVHRWIYFLDKESIPKRTVAAPPPGPIPGVTLIPAQPQTIRSDETAIEHVVRYLREPGFRSAVVFHDAESLLNHINADTWRMIGGMIDALQTAPSDQQGLCILLFTTPAADEIENWIGRQHMLAGLLRLAQGSRVRALPRPSRPEIDRAIDLVRLRDGLVVDWADRPMLLRLMMGANRSAKDWLLLLREASRLRLPFSVVSARREGWFQQSMDELRDPWERLDALIGAEPVKKHLRKLVNAIETAARERAEGRTPRPLPSMHMIFAGGPGTGKTTIAQLVGEILADCGGLARGHTVDAKAKDLIAPYLGQTYGRTDAKLNEAIDGVFFFDEAYQLDPGDQGAQGANAYGLQALETIMERMERDRGRLCVIMAGYPDLMRGLLRVNPGLERRLVWIDFPDYDPATLLRIADQMIQDFGQALTPDGREVVQRALERMYETRGASFGNAGEVRKLIEGMMQERDARIARDGLPADARLDAVDLPADYRRFLPRSATEGGDVWAEIDALVGLDKLKTHLHALKGFARIREMEAAAGRPLSPAPALHMIFEGNPGTGKTTVARLMGRVLFDLGLLSTDRLSEVGEADLVGEHVGESPTKTKRVIDAALNGVLFIDEAHQLVRSDGQAGVFGREALDALMARMENDRHRLCVVMAGYREPLTKLMGQNPGLERRIPPENRIVFADLSVGELLGVVRLYLAREQLEPPPALQERIVQAVESLHATRDGSFGNAGAMRNFAQQMLAARRSRIVARNLSVDAGLDLEDFPAGYANHLAPEVESVETILAELEGLTGLAPVKRFVRDQINLLRLEMHGASSLSVREPELRHMVFTGAPGTGKTTVARLMGRVFQTLGVVKRGHVVATSEQELTAGGWTEVGASTRKKVREALNGVLFIDEAYALAESPAGPRVVAELLTAMVDHRDRLVVIVAGYEREMENLFRINPGLRGRFPHHVAFPDYTANELVEIALRSAARQGYGLEEDVAPALRQHFAELLARRDGEFDNARAAERIVGEMKRRLAYGIFERGDQGADPRRFRAVDVPGAPLLRLAES